MNKDYVMLWSQRIGMSILNNICQSKVRVNLKNVKYQHKILALSYVIMVLALKNLQQTICIFSVMTVMDGDGVLYYNLF